MVSDGLFIDGVRVVFFSLVVHPLKVVVNQAAHVSRTVLIFRSAAHEVQLFCISIQYSNMAVGDIVHRSPRHTHESYEYTCIPAQ